MAGGGAGVHTGVRVQGSAERRALRSSLRGNAHVLAGGAARRCRIQRGANEALARPRCSAHAGLASNAGASALHGRARPRAAVATEIVLVDALQTTGPEEQAR